MQVLARLTSRLHFQRRDLPAEPAAGQLRQILGVPLPGDHLLQDRPAGDSQRLGGDAGEFHAGVLHQFLQPLDLPGLLLDHDPPGPGQVTQVPLGFRRHERGAYQAVRDEVRKPRGVGHIRFPAWYVTDMRGVEKPAFELVFQQAEDRFPVNPC
ncbi:hypothetical protein ThrDRAFT_04351 [Frankia casuarinae]|nr:hypothetical protein ThrDRAFT_04351 [Frankia casuarinae]